MKSLYHRVEQAVLHDYFGMPRLDALRDVDIQGENSRRRGPVRVVPSAEGINTELSLPNAVARIALSNAQGRLPQWALASPSGVVLLGREGWQREPQRVSLMPQFLFEINWADSGPGISWPEAYFCTSLPGFDRSVVTASVETVDGYGYTDFAIGWFPDSEDWDASVKRVITAWWRRTGNEWGWAYVLRDGAVSELIAREWYDEVWSTEPCL